jgi:hypothetical protein
MDVLNVPDSAECHDLEFVSIYAIPEHMAATLFPGSHLSISSFLEFHTPSVTPASTPLPDIQQYFCSDLPHSTAGQNLLSLLPIPSEPIVTALVSMAPAAWDSGKRSVIYAHTDTTFTYPFWVIAFWERVMKEITPSRLKWQAARRFVEQQSCDPSEPTRSVASHFQRLLSMFPWQGDVCGFTDFSPIYTLAQFASRDWLCDTNINFALELVRRQIKSNNFLAPFHDILQTYFVAKLRAVFESHNQRSDYLSAGDCLQLRQVGQDVANGMLSIGMICFVHSNHWLALVIEGSSHTIFIGDSLGHEAPASLRHAVERWLAAHTPIPFEWKPLACTRQQDQYSCGIFAVNAIGHHFLPDTYPLVLSRTSALDVARMQLGVAVIDVHMHALSVSYSFLLWDSY